MSYKTNNLPYVPRIYTGAPWVTYVIMICCVGIFIHLNLLADRTHINATRLLYMGGVSSHLMGAGMDFYVRFISAGFLHGNMVHLAMNMYALWIIGTKCEWYYGQAWFLVIYLISIIGSSYFSVTFHENPTWSVGASGGIMGLFAADLFVGKYFNPHKSWFSQDNITVLLINLVPGIISNVDYWGHFGGAISGGLMGFILTKILWRTFSTSALNALSYFLTALSVCALIYTAVNITGQYGQIITMITSS